jgi:hypothetical protein
MVNDYHALLPLLPRPVARFRVGIGRQTALTEPYRHLTEAYAQLTGAYAHAMKAYGQVSEELHETNATWAQFAHDFDALDVKTHWWRVPKLARLLFDLRAKLHAVAAPPAAGRGGRSDEHGDDAPQPRKPAP